DVAGASSRVAGEDGRQREVAAAVAGPAPEDRQRAQRGGGDLDDLLAGRLLDVPGRRARAVDQRHQLAPALAEGAGQARVDPPGPGRRARPRTASPSAAPPTR